MFFYRYYVPTTKADFFEKLYVMFFFFRECFKSIFRIHTETGNIWTHLLGVVAFLGLALYFITRQRTITTYATHV